MERTPNYRKNRLPAKIHTQLLKKMASNHKIRKIHARKAHIRRPEKRFEIFRVQVSSSRIGTNIK